LCFLSTPALNDPGAVVIAQSTFDIFQSTEQRIESFKASMDEVGQTFCLNCGDSADKSLVFPFSSLQGNMQGVVNLLQNHIKQWSFIEAQLLEPNVNLGMVSELSRGGFTNPLRDY